MQSSTRRRFLKTAAIGTVAGAVGAAPAHAQGQPRPTLNQAQLLAEFVRARFGRHLSDAQMNSVQQRMTRMLATSELLKRTPLTNGDEPAFVFVPAD